LPLSLHVQSAGSLWLIHASSDGHAADVRRVGAVTKRALCFVSEVLGPQPRQVGHDRLSDRETAHAWCGRSEGTQRALPR
jgi:hypothetical protein